MPDLPFVPPEEGEGGSPASRGTDGLAGFRFLMRRRPIARTVSRPGNRRKALGTIAREAQFIRENPSPATEDGRAGGQRDAARDGRHRCVALSVSRRVREAAVRSHGKRLSGNLYASKDSVRRPAIFDGAARFYQFMVGCFSPASFVPSGGAGSSPPAVGA